MYIYVHEYYNYNYNGATTAQVLGRKSRDTLATAFALKKTILFKLDYSKHVPYTSVTEFQ